MISIKPLQPHCPMWIIMAFYIWWSLQTLMPTFWVHSWCLVLWNPQVLPPKQAITSIAGGNRDQRDFSAGLFVPIYHHDRDTHTLQPINSTSRGVFYTHASTWVSWQCTRPLHYHSNGKRAETAQMSVHRGLVEKVPAIPLCSTTRMWRLKRRLISRHL